MNSPRAVHALIAVLATATLAYAAPAIVPSAAGATTAATPTGYIDHLRHSGAHVALSGWALDPAASSRSIAVEVYVDGKRVGRYPANRPRGDVNRALRVHGRHGFVITIRRPRGANLIQVYGVNRARHASGLLRGSVYLLGAPRGPSLSARIVAEARRYLGIPYRSGGTSPATGFDCSGYTMYVYSSVHAARLAHSAETQRHQVRLISRQAARPGDLIFYMSGGGAFHVAIFAGNGYQYVAPAPGQRVKLEHIWSSAIQFGTKRY